MPGRSPRRRRHKNHHKPITSPINASTKSEERTETRTQSTSTDDLVSSKAGKKRPSMLQLESVNRLTTFPVVESGWNIAGNVYNRVKNANGIISWTLQRAEDSLKSAVDTALPAIILFEAPISSIDKILCKSLDIVEQTIPSINLPPEMIYWNTKQYFTDVGTRIVRPVLTRADSVKQIGSQVLQSKYTEFAADTLDGALNVADRYVEKYLPADVYDDKNNSEKNVPVEGGKALQTIHHVGRISGKLQRRLTRRTLAEAKALKEQSAEAIHVLIYVAELVATDPKLALAKGKELWANLSKDEPENQARPENLEQLLVLLSREIARRVVHFVNYTSGIFNQIPKSASNKLLGIVSRFLNIADATVKSVHMEGVQKAIVDQLKYRAHHFTVLLKQLNIHITDLLDQVAKSLAPQEQPKAVLEVPRIKVSTLRASHRNQNQSSNGVDSNSN